MINFIYDEHYKFNKIKLHLFLEGRKVTPKQTTLLSNANIVLEI